MWQAACEGCAPSCGPAPSGVRCRRLRGGHHRRPGVDLRPLDDDRADPGEIVWAWVPFEEDHNQGKDRPVLVIGRRDGLLLALMLTSKDHDRDAADEARYGRSWVDLGTGAWDRQGRPSEVRVDRVLQLDPARRAPAGRRPRPRAFRPASRRPSARSTRARRRG